MTFRRSSHYLIYFEGSGDTCLFPKDRVRLNLKDLRTRRNTPLLHSVPPRYGHCGMSNSHLSKQPEAPFLPQNTGPALSRDLTWNRLLRIPCPSSRGAGWEWKPGEAPSGRC